MNTMIAEYRRPPLPPMMQSPWQYVGIGNYDAYGDGTTWEQILVAGADALDVISAIGVDKLNYDNFSAGMERKGYPLTVIESVVNSILLIPGMEKYRAALHTRASTGTQPGGTQPGGTQPGTQPGGGGTYVPPAETGFSWKPVLILGGAALVSIGAYRYITKRRIL